MRVKVDIKEVYFSLICSTQLLLVPTKCMSRKRRLISVTGTMNNILWMINEMILYNKMFCLECVVLFCFLVRCRRTKGLRRIQLFYGDDSIEQAYFQKNSLISVFMHQKSPL